MKPIKLSTLRAVSISFFIVLALVGLAFHTGTGTLSAFGYHSIAAICPLGSLEAMIASHTFIPTVMISLAVFLLVCIVLGRIFCAWMCPIPLFRKWFPKKNNPASSQKIPSSHATPEGATLLSSAKKVDTSYYILGGALGSSFLFGFPVFCLICPVGLTFAVIISLWRLIQFNEPTWSLLVFPLILALELIFFRFTCRKFCPLGALISLMSRANIFFKPTVNEKSCLRSTKGAECNICQTACHEEIDLHQPLNREALARCTKCSDCKDACPMHAISFKFFQKKSS